MNTKKIKNGFLTVPYEYLRDLDLSWEQRIIMSMINGFNRSGKPFINYYPTLCDILGIDDRMVQIYVDTLVDDGYLREVKSETSPIIQYYIIDEHMEV